MKLTRQEEIALLFTSELARNGEIFTSLSDVAALHGVSPLFLKKIARTLKKQGLVISKEGQNGGYVLGKPAETISAWEVMEAVAGKSSGKSQETVIFTCPLRTSCMPQTIRHLISESLKQYLSDVTIDQFVKKTYVA
jgi:Rrf2 family iron-responsive transcriptional regulator